MKIAKHKKLQSKQNTCFRISNHQKLFEITKLGMIISKNMFSFKITYPSLPMVIKM